MSKCTIAIDRFVEGCRRRRTLERALLVHLARYTEGRAPKRATGPGCRSSVEACDRRDRRLRRVSIVMIPSIRQIEVPDVSARLTVKPGTIGGWSVHGRLIAALGTPERYCRGIAELSSSQLVFNPPLAGGLQRGSETVEVVTSNHDSIVFHTKFDTRANDEECTVHVGAPHPGTQDGRTLRSFRPTLDGSLHRSNLRGPEGSPRVSGFVLSDAPGWRRAGRSRVPPPARGAPS